MEREQQTTRYILYPIRSFLIGEGYKARCEKCGSTWEKQVAHMFNYCPHCGRRISERIELYDND